MTLQTKLLELRQNLGSIILDKDLSIKLCLSCLLARGHLLLQDLPGMGKTTLAHALAQGFGLDFSRVQFTSDMLPADILGMNVYDQAQQDFVFRRGAVFSQLLLADEINRSSPKTQSALLEAMEEYQVSVDGTSHTLPEPFFVIATQNPVQQSGVYPLPESQLDRFLMCVSLGYPSPRAERELLLGQDRRQLLAKMPQYFCADELLQAQQQVGMVHLGEVVADYIQALIAKSRQGQHGLSPRAMLALKRAAQAHAYVTGQDNVAIDDVQAVFGAVANHRLGQRFLPNAPTLADDLIAQVRIR